MCDGVYMAGKGYTHILIKVVFYFLKMNVIFALIFCNYVYILHCVS